MSKVFISYSTKDLKDAQMVLQALESGGIPCWIAPRDIPGGSDYTSMIPAAIKNCQVMVLILSRNAENSNWVPLELTRAINNRKMIIPFVVEKYDIGDQFDFQLSIYQQYPAYENKQEALAQLVSRIRSLLGIPEPEERTIAPASGASRFENVRAWKYVPGKHTRLDGIYQHIGPDGQRDFLRFFQDGKVAYTRVTASALEVSKWLGPKYPYHAKARFAGDDVEFEIPLENGAKLTAEGSFLNSAKLALNMRNTSIQKAEETVVFGFCNLTFPKTYVQPPETGTHSPKKKLPKFPRFEGVYQHRASDGSWDYLRFFQDGRIAYTCTSNDPLSVASWFGPDYPGCGAGRVTGDQVEAEIPLLDGGTMIMKGSFQDPMRLVLELQNTTLKQTRYDVGFTFRELEFPKAYLNPPKRLINIAQCDGIYVRKVTKSQRDMIRVLPDGTALYVRTVQSPENVALWFSEKFPVRAENAVSGNRFAGEFTPPGSGKMTFFGTFTKGKLRANIVSEGKTGTETADFHFVSLAFPEEYIEPPKDPTCALRFDGIYRDSTTGGLTRYFRFYPDGLVVSAMASGSPKDVAVWLNRSYSNKGRYNLRKNTIWFTVGDSGKGKLKYMGLAKPFPSRIEAEVSASINEVSFEQKLSFVSDKQIQENEV